MEQDVGLLTHLDVPMSSRYLMLARFRAAKEQQERFMKMMRAPVTRCSRWPCEAQRINGRVLKKHFDYGVPDTNPEAMSERICTSQGPPITSEEKKYAGFGGIRTKATHSSQRKSIGSGANEYKKLFPTLPLSPPHRFMCTNILRRMAHH
eukprot:5023814-Pyramimonas_sp.AAC.1